MSVILKTIVKTLTRNDLGIGGSHQAGIHIPKNPSLIGFFPELNEHIKNPRIKITFYGPENEIWRFNFIYYNNKIFGGTRNEYRLTAMTKFFNKYNLSPDDKLSMSINENNIRFIGFTNKSTKDYNRGKFIILSNKWKEIKL
jgi:hypothetical protein|tara:strand:- start:329 stop:754 length:426 start_codon:yes stop_codon:yes gene_type:complete